MWTAATYTFSLLCVYFVVKALKKFSNPRLPLPPGPKGYPIIGNILDIPAAAPWRTFEEWSRSYGSYSYYLLKF